MLDALVHPVVEAGPQADPPEAPVEGRCWLGGADAVDAWAGKDDMIAIWTSGGWRFVAPRAAMCVARLTDGASLRFDGESWIEPPAITSPAGGSTIDSEARSVIVALILLFESHGLLISG